MKSNLYRGDYDAPIEQHDDPEIEFSVKYAHAFSNMSDHRPVCIDILAAVPIDDTPSIMEITKTYHTKNTDWERQII